LKLRKQAVAGGCDQSSIVLGDLWFEEIMELAPYPTQRCFFVRFH
jgi:hypothetical protein